MKKSLVVIIADQLSFRALPFYGNEHVKTPHIDKFFEQGFVFENAYTACPLCLPARSAMWSGHFPHQTKAMSNAGLLTNPDLPASMPSLGDRLSDAGYKCVHFGKTHDAGSLRGFDIIPNVDREDIASDVYAYNYDSFRDIDTCEKATNFFKDVGDDPFAVILDFYNPHNICGFTGHAASLAENAIGDLPPLPPNFEVDDMASRPLPVQYLCCTHNRQQQATQWEPLRFQQYLAAYYHYIEMLDRQLGEIFDALVASGQLEQTVICLSADHGDNMGARRMTTKHSSFYEETTHIPLLFAGAGIPNGSSEALVSHLDFLPTFCSVLGVEIESTLWGTDLQALMLDESKRAHDYVVSEWHSEWGTTVEPCRMLRNDTFKYTLYRENEAEELYDMVEDPYEMRNLINDADYAQPLATCRQQMAEHFKNTDDEFLSMEFVADARWRSHKPGFKNHEGPTAPQVMLK